jgi:Leucine-rich repeat (LRR) protein
MSLGQRFRRLKWIAIALALAVICAAALAFRSDPSIFSRVFAGRLGSLGVKVEPESDGGVKVAARQTTIGDDELALIAAMSGVTHLDLYGCDEITAEGFGHLQEMISLRRLNLTGTRIEDLSPLAACPEIEALALDRAQVQAPSFAVLRDKSAVRILSVNQTVFDDECLRTLGPKPALTALYLASTKVSGDAMQFLEQFPQLEVLNLSGTQLTDADLAPGRWPELAHLKNLFLNDLPITDAGLASLQTTVQEKLPGLESLGLANTEITSVSFDMLRGLPQLKTIRLSGTPIPREDIEALRLDMADTYIEGN